MTKYDNLHAEARAFMARFPELDEGSLDEWLVVHHDILTEAERREGAAIVDKFCALDA